jgi:hypothetical protein
MLYAFCQEFGVPHTRIAFGDSGVQGLSPGGMPVS